MVGNLAPWKPLGALPLTSEEPGFPQRSVRPFGNSNVAEMLSIVRRTSIRYYKGRPFVHNGETGPRSSLVSMSTGSIDWGCVPCCQVVIMNPILDTFSNCL